jgi:predicted lipoprotein with Yx(FWY)xxD motif
MNNTLKFASAGAAVLGLALTACSSSKSTSSTTVASAAPSGTTATTAAPVSATSSGVVSVAKVGADQALVGPNGHTLYLLETETGTTSQCTGGCAAIWPGLASAGAPSAGSGVDATKLSTANGQVPNQVTYNGHLLYYFGADSAPGDVKGTSIPHWYPVSPAGDKIDHS